MIAFTPDHLLWIDHLFTAVWTIIAMFAVRVLLRTPSSQRGAWRVIAGYCVIIVVDKLIDVQIMFYRVCHALMDTLEPWVDRRHHHAIVMYGMLIPLTLVAVGGTLFLVRADHHLDRSKRWALGGLVVVLCYVGLRLLPGVREWLDLWIGWGIETVAAAMVFHGERLAARGQGKVPHA